MKPKEKRANLFTATAAMEKYFDEYDHFNFERKYTEPHSRKGRSKRESQLNTNRPNPSGHERKVVQKLMNSEKNKRGET